MSATVSIRPNTVFIKYGLLYNWYALTDNRNIANTGWHAPALSDFVTLSQYMGFDYTMEEGDARPLKTVGYEFWELLYGVENTGTNEYKFNAKGVGVRQIVPYAEFDGKGVYTAFWMTTSGTGGYSNSAWAAEIGSDVDFMLTDPSYGMPVRKQWGFSIRLVKDSTILTHGQTGIYTGNDGFIYPTICIGTQEWVAENLVETKYRNGDTIPEVTNRTSWDALTTGALCAYNNDLSNVYI